LADLEQTANTAGLLVPAYTGEGEKCMCSICSNCYFSSFNVR